MIPTRRDQRRNREFDQETYRRRNITERAMDRLKESRRLGTRFEQRATSFPGMARLAVIQLCPRLLASSERAW